MADEPIKEEEQKKKCPKCGSENIVDAGKQKDSDTDFFPLYECKDCGELFDLIKKSDKFSDELAACQKERDEYLDGWKRAKADFLNYQKDERKRMEEFLKWTQAAFVEDLLPVLDSFDLAFSAQGGQGTQTDSQFKGFALIKSQLDEILKKRGLEPIKSVGEKFNPEFHEAVATVDSTSLPQVEDKESQMIVEEMQKGYLLNGRVLRPAKVKIIK